MPVKENRSVRSKFYLQTKPDRETTNTSDLNVSKEQTNLSVQNTQENFGNQELQAAVQGDDLSALQSVIFANVSMDLAGFGQEASNTENIGIAQTLARHKNNKQSSDEPAIERVQSVLQESGRPLPKDLRERLERSFGHDLSDVRIHTDGQAQIAAQSIRADAFAAGTHIAFNRGAYNPNTKQGDELIGHEVAHVVQFKEGRMGQATASEGGVPVTSPSDGVEREAEQLGADFAQGILDETTHHSEAALIESSVGPTIARKESQEENPEDRPDIDLEKAEEEKKRFEESGKKEEQEEKENAESTEKTEEHEAAAGEEQEEQEEKTEEQEKVEPELSSMESMEGGGGASSGAGGAATVPQLDNLVDYYMETHWDRSEYKEKLEEYDLLVSEYSSVSDGLNLSDGASTALGWAGNMLKIGTDAILIGGVKAIPGVGVIFHVAYGIRDIIKNNKEYGALDDSFGKNVANLRSVADIIGSVVGNILDGMTVIQDFATALSWTGVGALVAGFLAIVGEVGNGIAFACDSIKTVCSTFLTIHNVSKAQEAERNGNFRQAAQYRELAQGTAIDTVVDFIGMVSTLLSASTLNAIPGEVGEDLAEAAGDIAQKSAQELAKSDPGAFSSTKMGERLGSTGAAGKYTGSTVTNNLLYQVGLGDAMKLSEDGPMGERYLSPSAVSGGGQVASILQGSRTAAIDRLDAAHADISGDNPKWNQKIINDIISPADQSFWDTVSKAMSPYSLVQMMLGGVVSLFNITEEMSSGAISGILNGAATGIETLLEPAVQGINGWIQEAKPALDELALNLSTAIQEQTVSLQAIQESIPHITEFLSQINTLFDAKGSISSAVETLSSSISSAQIDPEQLDIPGWVPESTYMWAIDGINSMIGSVASGIDSVNSSVIPVIDSFVEEQTAWAQGQLDSISLAVAEGGEVDTLLQGSFQMVQDGISMMMEQFAEWEPVLDLGFTEAVASLRSAATSVEDSSYSSRVDDFKNFLQTDAQAQVDSWKAEHKESVETAYYMPVLDEDISAVEQAWGILDPKLNEAVSDNQLPFRTYQSALVAVAEAKAQKGKKGQEALNKVWGAGDMLASIAGRLGV